MNSKNSSFSWESLQEPKTDGEVSFKDSSDNKTLYKLTKQDIDRIDKLDSNPAQRASKIQKLLINQDPYNVLCFCVIALPALIVQAPPLIHKLTKHLAAYVYQYHYFIRNEKEL